jgi:hypothetical protein
MEGTYAVIKILEKEDTKPAIEVKPGETVVRCELETFLILEAGTSKGNTSVTFHTRDDQGRHIIIETTGNIFETMNGAFVGANIRFAEKKAKKN